MLSTSCASLAPIFRCRLVAEGVKVWGKGYGETASPDADAWEVEERPILLPPGGGSYGGQASWSGW